MADSGVSPCKTIEDDVGLQLMADDENSNDSMSQTANTNLQRLEVKRQSEKMNEAVNLFAKIDKEKRRKQNAQDTH